MADLLVLLDFVFDDSNNNFDLAALVLPFAEEERRVYIYASFFPA